MCPVVQISQLVTFTRKTPDSDCSTPPPVAPQKRYSPGSLAAAAAASCALSTAELAAAWRCMFGDAGDRRCNKQQHAMFTSCAAQLLRDAHIDPLNVMQIQSGRNVMFLPAQGFLTQPRDVVCQGRIA